MNKYMLIPLALMLGLNVASAQVVKDFTLRNVVNDSNISLSSYANKKGVVLIFTSNVCPYSVYYEGRITQLISDYEGQGIQFLLVNSHTEDKESAVEMKNKISTWGLNVPYLTDKDQTVLKALGVRKSPEVFLLRYANGGFTVFYRGAIDNNPQVASDVKNQYLKENLDLLLQGKTGKAGGRPIGCMVKSN